MKKILFLFAILSMFSSAHAASKNWDILPSRSKINFSAKSDGSEINGYFNKFGGIILFDREDLMRNKIVIDIDVTSLDTSLKEATQLLATKDWFDFAKYPQAKFSSQKILPTPDGKYRCSGTLKIKDKEVPLTFDFSFEEYSKTEARAVGSFTLKRSDFGIGNKDEKKAEGVKDEVVVKFSVTAIPRDLKVGI